MAGCRETLTLKCQFAGGHRGEHFFLTPPAEQQEGAGGFFARGPDGQYHLDPVSPVEQSSVKEEARRIAKTYRDEQVAYLVALPLLREIERLRGERDACIKDKLDIANAGLADRERAEAAEARVKELEGALRVLADSTAWELVECWYPAMSPSERAALDTVRVLLAPKPTGEK